MVLMLLSHHLQLASENKRTTLVWAACEQSCHSFWIIMGQECRLLLLTLAAQCQNLNGEGKWYCLWTLILETNQLACNIMCSWCSTTIAELYKHTSLPLQQSNTVHRSPRTTTISLLKKASRIESTNMPSQEDKAHHRSICTETFKDAHNVGLLLNNHLQSLQTTDNWNQVVPIAVKDAQQGGCLKAME